MTWVLVILLGVIAVPVVIELTKDRMGRKARTNAPGQFAQLSQGATHYEWFGPPRGPVVVCIHGLTTPSFVWGGLTKGLALMGFRVLTYDLYGRGFSDRPRGAQTKAFFVEQLNDLLSHEDVNGKLIVIGYSMGGAIATAFAAQRAKRIAHLVLLAPAGMMAIGTQGMTRLILKTPVLGDWLMWAVYPFQLRKGIAAERNSGYTTSVPDIWDLQENELRYRGFVPAVLASLRGILSHKMRAKHTEVAEAKVPTLVIWGHDDDVIPYAASEVLTAWNPDAVQEVIYDAGHGLTYTHSAEALDLFATHVPLPQSQS